MKPANILMLCVYFPAFLVYWKRTDDKNNMIKPVNCALYFYFFIPVVLVELNGRAKGYNYNTNTYVNKLINAKTNTLIKRINKLVNKKY